MQKIIRKVKALFSTKEAKENENRSPTHPEESKQVNNDELLLSLRTGTLILLSPKYASLVMKFSTILYL